MRTEFFLLMIPPTVTHQEHQVTCKSGKPVFYEPPELKAARIKLQAYLAQHIPIEKYTTAVRLVVKWCFPVKGKHKDGEYKTTKPDVTNLQKMLEDIMTDLGYWTDDALIASAITEKFWAITPGIYVCIDKI